MTLLERTQRIAYGGIMAQTIGDPRAEYLAAVQDLARACALLTSPRKAEREQGKTLVRAWKRAGWVSHAKPDAVE